MAILYKSSYFYHTLMAIVYGKHRRERLNAVAQWIPEGADVLDICSGDGALTESLHASVNYKGLDLSEAFVENGRKKGRDIEHFDVSNGPFPPSQVVVCQVSLFQFHPNHEDFLARMFDAAQERLIISESVFSLTQSRWSWLSSIVAWGTEAKGMADTRFRFTPESLRELFSSYQDHIRHSEAVCGGRDWVYVLDK